MTRSAVCTKADLDAMDTRLGKRVDSVAGDFSRLEQKMEDAKNEIIRHFDVALAEMKAMVQAMDDRRSNR